MAFNFESFLTNALSKELNQNIKSVSQGSDGSITTQLFDGNSPKPVGSPKVPQVTSSAMQTKEVPEPIPQVTPSFLDKANSLFSNPVFLNALADFGKAFSHNIPTEPGTILGNAAKSSIKSGVFSKYLNSLQDPQAPKLSSAELGLLSPEERVAAESAALRAKQETSASELRKAETDLAGAQTEKLRGEPSFEEKTQAQALLKILGRKPETIKPPSSVIYVDTLPDGTKAPPGKLFAQQLDPTTKGFTRNAGLIDKKDAPGFRGSGSGKDPRPNASLINQMKEATLALMNPVVKNAIARRLGVKRDANGNITSEGLKRVNDIYNSFKVQGTGEIKTSMIRSFLNPEENQQFAEILGRFEDDYVTGGKISQTERDLFNKVVEHKGGGVYDPSVDGIPTPQVNKPKLQLIQ